MKDRVSLYPGRVKLTPVAGQADTYDLVRADSPTQEGTPLNKNTLLKDTTAALYGLGNEAVPDEVFRKIPDNFGIDGTFKVGDIVSSQRTDLSDKWVLCNGAVIAKDDYPDLASLDQSLCYGFTGINSPFANMNLPTGHKVYGQNKIILYVSGYNYDSTTYACVIIDCDSKTGERYTITSPYAGWALLGIDHNGTYWVTAWGDSSETIKLATMSDDFSTVQNEYSVYTGYKQYADDSMVATNFLFNGSHYYLSTRYSGHTSILVNVFDSNFGLAATNTISPGNTAYSGYLFRFGPYVALGYSNTSYGFIDLYTSGANYTRILNDSTSSLYTSTDSNFKYVRYAIRITDTHYILGGMGYGVTNTNLYIYNSTTNKLQAIMGKTLGLPSNVKFGWIFYDRKKRSCILVASLSGSNAYYMLSIDYGKDPTIASNYTLKTLAESPVKSNYSIYNAVLDDTQTVWDFSNRAYIADSLNIPTISLDGVYTYIKAKE